MTTHEERARGKGSRGNGKPTQLALAGFGVGDQQGGFASWSEASEEAIHAVVVAVTRIGGAVMFGQSRDGGALSVTVYLDGDRKVVWIAGNEDPDPRLAEIFEWFDQHA